MDRKRDWERGRQAKKEDGRMELERETTTLRSQIKIALHGCSLTFLLGNCAPWSGLHLGTVHRPKAHLTFYFDGVAWGCWSNTLTLTPSLVVQQDIMMQLSTSSRDIWLLSNIWPLCTALGTPACYSCSCEFVRVKRHVSWICNIFTAHTFRRVPCVSIRLRINY